MLIDKDMEGAHIEHSREHSISYTLYSEQWNVFNIMVILHTFYVEFFYLYYNSVCVYVYIDKIKY